jgi:prepilin peptidase CpaA
VTISQMAAWAALVFFPGAMVFAAVMDFMTMKIRNRLVIAIVLGYAVLAPLAGFGLQEMALSLAIAAGVFLAGFLFFSMGWIGGGDAKLAAATVLWLGADVILAYLIYTALLGGVLTLAILGFRRLRLPARWLTVDWVARLHAPQSGVPYGAAMAPAALLVFPDTPWMAAIL